MRASELIKELNKMVEEIGNVEVYAEDSESTYLVERVKEDIVYGETSIILS